MNLPAESIVETLSDLKHRVFPRPFERLAVQGTNIVGVEVGVYRGLHAESLLNHLPIHCLYLVDPYKACEDFTQDDLDDADREAQRRMLEAPLPRGGINFVRLPSVTAAKHIPVPLDFVYIDGNHAEQSVTEDIWAWWPLLKSGGVIGGHDFYNGFCREHDGVVNAVTRFAVSMKVQLRVEPPDWWIVKL